MAIIFRVLSLELGLLLGIELVQLGRLGNMRQLRTALAPALS